MLDQREQDYKGISRPKRFEKTSCFLIDDTERIQQKFLKHTRDFMEEVECHGNPFCESDLLVLQTNNIIPDYVTESLSTAEQRGINQYDEFVIKRLESQEVPIDAPIPNNKILRPGYMPEPKNKEKAHTEKDDIHLIGKLCIAMEQRAGSSDKLFTHENKSEPPSISKDVVRESSLSL